MKVTQNKQVTPEILKAFGFKKLKKKNKWIPEATHCHQKLKLFYSPKLHPLNVFAQNYTNAVVYSAFQKIQDMAHEITKNISTSDNP